MSGWVHQTITFKVGDIRIVQVLEERVREDSLQDACPNLYLLAFKAWVALPWVQVGEANH